jgi:putative tryptophan/tyrosine transport system substrate-binding protein
VERSGHCGDIVNASSLTLTGSRAARFAVMHKPAANARLPTEGRMRRRDFIKLVGNGAAAWPLAARAQQPAMPKVGFLNPGMPGGFASSIQTAFFAGLKDSGYIEGQNVAIEYRWSEGHNERLASLAADLVRRNVTVVFAAGIVAALAIKTATTSIPIVFQLGVDPVKAGLVGNLNRPGGNVTGATNITFGLAAKRLGLLHELVPSASTIAVLEDPNLSAFDTQRADLQEAAQARGLQLIFLDAGSAPEIDTAFENLIQKRASAVLFADSPLFNIQREQIVALAARHAIPSMYTFSQFAASGGLISYASSIIETTRQAGNYVGRILKGEKPSDLPVMQPTKFELVINLKTAKVLGLTVPPGLLAIADEVIE